MGELSLSHQMRWETLSSNLTMDLPLRNFLVALRRNFERQYFLNEKQKPLKMTKQLLHF